MTEEVSSSALEEVMGISTEVKELLDKFGHAKAEQILRERGAPEDLLRQLADLVLEQAEFEAWQGEQAARDL